MRTTLRVFRGALAGLLAASVPIGVYWCGGGDFERNHNLGVAVGAACVFATVAFFATLAEKPRDA